MAVTKDMSVFHRFLAIFPLHLATTIPDIYSIAIYLKIRTYAKKQDQIEVRRNTSLFSTKSKITG